MSDLQAEMPPRMIASLRQTARPLSAFFGNRSLRRISLTDLIAYQHARRNDGRAARTVDSELSVVLQLLDYGRLWHGVGENDWPMLTDKEQPRETLDDAVQALRLPASASTKAPSSTALPPTEAERATCPCCGRTTLVFRRLRVLLSGRSGRDRNGEELNRLRYAQEWTCENAACGYRRVINCRTEVHDMP